MKVTLSNANWWKKRKHWHEDTSLSNDHQLTCKECLEHQWHSGNLYLSVLWGGCHRVHLQVHSLKNTIIQVNNIWTNITNTNMCSRPVNREQDEFLDLDDQEAIPFSMYENSSSSSSSYWSSFMTFLLYILPFMFINAGRKMSILWSYFAKLLTKSVTSILQQWVDFVVFYEYYFATYGSLA